MLLDYQRFIICHSDERGIFTTNLVYYNLLNSLGDFSFRKDTILFEFNTIETISTL
jgi:hypothetical protein